MTATLRTFFAVDLPDLQRERVAALQDELRAQGLAARWVPAANLHLTLKFLGAVPVARLAAIQDAAAAALADWAPIALSLVGLGVFPHLRRPRVLWVGVEGETARLVDLQQGLEAALAAVGCAPENRPFQSHLTIARFKEAVPPVRVAAALEAFRAFTAPTFAVAALELFESRLRPEGPTYHRLARFPLDGGREPGPPPAMEPPPA
jgi:2'-5' RNA ligase